MENLGDRFSQFVKNYPQAKHFISPSFSSFILVASHLILRFDRNDENFPLKWVLTELPCLLVTLVLGFLKLQSLIWKALNISVPSETKDPSVSPSLKAPPKLIRSACLNSVVAAFSPSTLTDASH